MLDADAAGRNLGDNPGVSHPGAVQVGSRKRNHSAQSASLVGFLTRGDPARGANVCSISAAAEDLLFERGIAA